MEKVEFFKNLFKDNLVEIREFNNLFPVIVLKESDPDKLSTFTLMKKNYNAFYKFLPIFLNSEFILNAKDTFPADILYIKDFSVNIYGNDNFKDIQLDNNFLRLNIEKELRSKQFVITSSSYALSSKSDIAHFVKDLFYSLRYVGYAYLKIKNFNISFTDEIDLFISIANLLNFSQTSKLQDIIKGKGNYTAIQRFNIIYDLIKHLINNIEI